MTPTEIVNRQDRRRSRTRAALVRAARAMLATRDVAAVSIQEITDAADVGLGSFYNHFETKGQLFEAAVDEVLVEQGVLLDSMLAEIADPAERFGTGVRLAGRLPRYHPEMADIMLRIGLDHIDSPRGIGPRALRDLEEARRAGRFRFRDSEAALHATVGALLGIGHYIAKHPERLDRTVDELALQLLQSFSLPSDEARRILRRKLPRMIPT